MAAAILGATVASPNQTGGKDDQQIHRSAARRACPLGGDFLRFFLGAVIVVIVIGSDDPSDDNPEAFLPEVPAASPTEPAPTPTAPIAPTSEPTVRPTPRAAEPPETESLSATLEAIRSETGAPAVAAAIFSLDGRSSMLLPSGLGEPATVRP